ncbi:MAG: NAD(P)/FAD-dependent oxidoreductase [Pseudomonadota bacterium]
MAHQILETDYLIIGAGAVGMAFADTILTESDAEIVMVDRYGKPGGHWNAAYPFVQLHQPSQFYGVSSKELSGGRLEQGGLNDGLNELASGAEVSAYFDDVMRHQFLPSGRLQFFPMCEYKGEGRFESIVGNVSYEVTVRKKIVDATFLKTKVPSTHTPNFSIEDGVKFIPLNDLPKLQESPERYMVIGGGKTGIDACLWLLQMGVDPDTIDWVRPRDSWLLNRKNTQPTDQFFYNVFGAQLALMEAAASASSYPDLFARLEAGGYFLRLDPEVMPGMFHGATISEAELDVLQSIRSVIRLGRITHLGQDEIRFQKGTLTTGPNTVYVDCSARPIDDLPEGVPVFDGQIITPQMLRSYQPVFSAALAAHIELSMDSDEEKNAVTTPVPPPEADTDFAYFTAVSMTNQYLWSQNEDISAWMMDNRLDGFSRMVQNALQDDDKKALLMKMRKFGPDAVMNLHKIHNAYHAKDAA